MTADRMKRVRDVLNAEQGNLFNEHHLADDAIDAYCTLTDEEWGQVREKVAEVAWSNEGWVIPPRLPWPEWARDWPEGSDHFRHMAEAAMHALGFKREAATDDQH